VLIVLSAGSAEQSGMGKGFRHEDCPSGKE